MSVRPNPRLEFVTGQLGIELGDAELDRINKMAAKQANVKADALRMCTLECPMRDTCIYITGVEERLHPDKTGKRCPVEALIWMQQYDKEVAYIASLDPESQIPDLERGLADECAYLYVMEHRARAELARHPDQIVRAPVPGTDGATAEEVNPRIESWVNAHHQYEKAQQHLHKMVMARIKEGRSIQARQERTLASLRDEVAKNPNKYKGTRLGGFIDTMNKRVDKNQGERVKARENQDSNGADTGSES